MTHREIAIGGYDFESEDYNDGLAEIEVFEQVPGIAYRRCFFFDNCWHIYREFIEDCVRVNAEWVAGWLA